MTDMAKKDPNKFTVLFNDADPQHKQVVEILNRQGRRKAQFLVNTVQHYLHCKETPDIPQSVPTDTAAIEAVVRRILLEGSDHTGADNKTKQNTVAPVAVIEQPAFDEAADLLGEEGIAAIRNTMASFRK